MAHEEIVLGEGDYRNFGELGDGDVFENVLIDVTAGDAAFKLNAVGDGWVIRNVGVRGQPWKSGERYDDHLFNVAATGGEGLVENLFIDARSRDGGDTLTSMGGVRAKPNSHRGTVRMRNCCILGMGNNASYASSAGKNNSDGGAWIYEDCYHRDNVPTNFRPGTRGSVIRNCVSISDDPDCLRGEYKGSRDSRGIRGAWVNHCPDQLIEDSAFYTSSRDCQGVGFGYKQVAIIARNIGSSDCGQTEVEVINCAFGGDNMDQDKAFTTEDGDSTIIGGDLSQHSRNPSVTILRNGGVPLNPVMAAEGQRGYPEEVGSLFPLGGYSDPPDQPGGPPPDDTGDRLRLNSSSDTQTTYEFTVDGTIQAGAGVGTGDEIIDNGDGTMTARGFVRGGEDDYVVEGPFLCFSTDGPAMDITRDGTPVDVPSIAECPVEPGNGGENGGEEQPQEGSVGRVLGTAIAGGIASTAIKNALFGG